MANATFTFPKDPCSFSDYEDAFILVTTPLKAGVLKFLRLVIENIDPETLKVIEQIEVPISNLSIIYWNTQPNAFGINLKMFSWESVVGSRTMQFSVKVEAEYSMQTTMSGDGTVDLYGDAHASFSRASQPNAGFSLFGLNRALLLAGIAAAPALALM